MQVTKYLFHEYNVPDYSKDKVNKMNGELKTRLQIVAQSFRECHLDSEDDEDLYFTIADNIHSEIFRRYC
jgi:hypothetical protein